MAHNSRLALLKFGWLLLSILALSACSGGAETQTNPPAPLAPVSQPYSGPASQTDDIQAFKLNVWENLRTDERCSRCHVSGQQAPFFMRDDNINLAYAAALPLIDRERPFESRLVTKVGGGHNCWLESNVACADVMLRWIENWLGAGPKSNFVNARLKFSSRRATRSMQQANFIPTHSNGVRTATAAILTAHENPTSPTPSLQQKPTRKLLQRLISKAPTKAVL